jgi:hypothetical protein
MRRLFKYVALVALSVVFQSGPASAQDPDARRVRQQLATALQATPPLPVPNANASDTRQQFSELLEHYPPSLVWVLQIDPTLMTNKEYLAAYPGLEAFLSKHPEILRNPAYFLDGFRGPGLRLQNSKTQSSDEVVAREVATPAAVSIVLITVALSIAWIIKSVIEHTRWNRTIKAQNEIHLKLMERFSSNDDLLAYIQSPAGRRFLESASLANLGRASAAPVRSILWSVQAGMVLILGGIGLNYATNRLPYVVGEPLFVLSMLAISVGAGFILSALASYIISVRMGLFQGTSETQGT